MLGRTDIEQLEYACKTDAVIVTHNRVDFENLYDENYKVLNKNRKNGIPVFAVTMKITKAEITNIEIIAA